MEAAQAENMVLQVQKDWNAAAVAKKVLRVAGGDCMHLSKDHMITQAHAERELVAKELAIVQAQE